MNKLIFLYSLDSSFGHLRFYGYISLFLFFIFLPTIAIMFPKMRMIKWKSFRELPGCVFYSLSDRMPPTLSHGFVKPYFAQKHETSTSRNHSLFPRHAFSHPNG